MTARGSLQVQPSRQDPGVVDHDEVAGLAAARAGRATWRCSDVARRSSVDQQAGRVPGLDGRLGDALGRQRVVEVGGAHRASAYAIDLPCPAMTTRTDQVTVGDGAFDLHVWLPDAGSGPGILLIQEIFGVGPYIRAVAERLAGLGYVVGAPDVFWRIQRNWESGHDEQGLNDSLGMISKFDFAKGIEDCVAALDAPARQARGHGRGGRDGLLHGRPAHLPRRRRAAIRTSP